MIRLAHAKDLLTTPYVFNAEEAAEMARAGADIILRRRDRPAVAQHDHVRAHPPRRLGPSLDQGRAVSGSPTPRTC
jgi:hypothetical protein